MHGRSQFRLLALSASMAGLLITEGIVCGLGVVPRNRHRRADGQPLSRVRLDHQLRPAAGPSHRRGAGSRVFRRKACLLDACPIVYTPSRICCRLADASDLAAIEVEARHRPRRTFLTATAARVGHRGAGLVGLELEIHEFLDVRHQREGQQQSSSGRKGGLETVAKTPVVLR
jgi:hypothetical protein